MAVELLIAATNLNPYQKGDIVVAKQSPAVWGGAEGLPNFIRLTITDRDLVDIEPYLESFENVLQGEGLGIFDGNRRVRLFVDPDVVGKVDDARAFKAELRDFFVNTWGGRVVSGTVTPTEATIDFPLSVALADVKRELVDKFDDRLFERRYYFSEASVDQVVGIGGLINRTFSQVAAVVQDRRD
jgi:hypothetical protein